MNPEQKSRALDIAAIFFLGLFLLQSAGHIRQNSLTYDEGPHIAAALSAWKTGDFRVFNVNPPLARMFETIPLAFMDVEVPLDAWEARYGVEMINGIAAVWQGGFHTLVMTGRFMTLLLSLILAVLVWRDARASGPVAGLVAAALFCFQPLLIGHGSLVTTEAAATLAFFVTILYFLRRSEKGWTLVGAVTCGLALGAALSTKFSNVTLFFILPALILMRRGKSPARTRLGKGIGLAAAALVAAWLIVNLSYGFSESFFRWSTFQPTSRPLLLLDRALPDWLPMPLPRHLVEGFDRQTRYNEDFGGKNALTLRGSEWIKGRNILFFPHLTLIKLTPPLLLLFGLALVMNIRRLARGEPTDRRFGPYLAAAGIHFFMMAYVAENYHSFRYMIQIVPLMIVVAAVEAGRLAARWRNPVAALAVAASLFIGLSAYPYYLPYNNLLRGTGEKAFLQGDPDLCADWGQGLIALKQWLDRHPAHDQIYLAHIGSIDARYYGIKWELPPSGPRPGLWVVNRNALYCPPGNTLVLVRDNKVRVFDYGQPPLEWLKGRKPEAVVAGTILIFRIEQP